jgi:hypothetical protein
MLNTNGFKIEFARESAWYLRHARAAIAAYGDEGVSASDRPAGMRDVTWLTLLWVVAQLQAGIDSRDLVRRAKEAAKFDRLCAQS